MYFKYKHNTVQIDTLIEDGQYIVERSTPIEVEVILQFYKIICSKRFEIKICFRKQIIYNYLTFSGGIGRGFSCLMQKYCGTCIPNVGCLTVPNGVSTVCDPRTLVHRAESNAIALRNIASLDSDATREAFLKRQKQLDNQ